MIVFAFVLLISRRDDIKQILEKRIESFSGNPTNSDDSFEKSKTLPNNATQIGSESLNIRWKSIRSKWSPILPDREMKLLEILFINGSMNQQALADELGVSKGTISRIISRLESKNLLFRERFGISKLISLNKDRFQ